GDGWARMNASGAETQETACSVDILASGGRQPPDGPDDQGADAPRSPGDAPRSPEKVEDSNSAEAPSSRVVEAAGAVGLRGGKYHDRRWTRSSGGHRLGGSRSAVPPARPGGHRPLSLCAWGDAGRAPVRRGAERPTPAPARDPEPGGIP